MQPSSAIGTLVERSSRFTMLLYLSPMAGREGPRVKNGPALDNLVENALRHGAGTISVSAAARDGTVELRVSDEGPGFPPAFLGQAFDRFTRADPARGRGGSGLGLSIVQLIARVHDGVARAQNDLAGARR